MWFLDAFAAWLVGRVADASSARLVEWALGGEQDRALRRAAAVAVQRTIRDLCPEHDEASKSLAMVIGEVFGTPVPQEPLGQAGTLLEAIRQAVSRQLALLGDEVLVDTGDSSAAPLGIPASDLADVLTRNLLREIIERGARGGPLAPLANQLSHDRTHLQGQQIIVMLGEALELAEIRAGSGEAALEAATMLTALDDSCRGPGRYTAVLDVLVAKAARDGGHSDLEVQEFRDRIRLAGLDPRVLISQMAQHQEALRRWTKALRSDSDPLALLASFTSALRDELSQELFNGVSEDCRRFLVDALADQHTIPVSVFLDRLARQLPPSRSTSREAVLVRSNTGLVPSRPGEGARDQHRIKLTSIAAQMTNLPPADPYMTGREWLVSAEAAAIKATVARRGAATGFLSGQPGVGTSAVAIEIARELAPAFPGGVHYVDLRGLFPDARRDARTVVRLISEAMGLDLAAAVEGDDRLFAAFGAQLTGRGVLLLLDNALDADHVTPLAPAPPTCCVIVTSRDRLQDYADPGLVTLVGPLDRASASHVLALHAEDRASQTHHLDRLAALCADVPLALRILGARIASRPDLDLAYLAQVLDAEATRLDYLEVGDRAVRAAIQLSYDGLDRATQGVLRLVAAAPGGIVTGAELAHCRGEAADRQEVLLNRLADHNLAQQSVLWLTAGLLARFTLFDLVRLFAAECDEVITPAEIHEFRRRFVSYLSDQLDAIIDDADAAEFSGELDPARFHAAERTAEEEGWLDLAADLAFGLYILYRARKELDSVIAANDVRVRLHLARRQYDRAASACLLNADDLRGMNSAEHAMASARRARQIAHDHQLPLRIAEADSKISLILGEQKKWAEALQAGEHAISRLTELGRESFAFSAAINNCIFANQKHDNSEALRWGRKATELADRYGEPYQQGSAALQRGRAEEDAGNRDTAIELFQRARTINEADHRWWNAAIACSDAARAAEHAGDITMAASYLAAECDHMARGNYLPELLEALIDLSALHVRAASLENAYAALERALNAANRSSAPPPPLIQQELLVRQATVRIFLNSSSTTSTDPVDDAILAGHESNEPLNAKHARALNDLRKYHARKSKRYRARLLHDISRPTWNQPDRTPLRLHNVFRGKDLELPGGTATAIS